MRSSSVIRDFYKAREAGDPEMLRHFIADDVTWREPSVGLHMGELTGVDAVVDMIGRALAATGGTFSLEVTDTVEVDGHCACVVAWSADKGATIIRGRELAVFSISEGKINFAQFLPENIGNDRAFWA